MNTKLIFAGGLMLGVGSAALAAPFQNGSFENGTNPPSNYRSIYTGDMSITGWDIVNRVDWSNKAGNPGWVEDGNLSAELVSQNAQLTSIAQTFDTTPGALTVGFWVTEVPNIQTTPLSVSLTNNGQTQTDLVTFPTMNASYSFAFYSFQFSTAAGTSSSTLTFSQTGTYEGPFIDNVTVSAVPEPTPLLGLGGCLLALTLRRSRRSG